MKNYIDNHIILRISPKNHTLKEGFPEEVAFKFILENYLDNFVFLYLKMTILSLTSKWIKY